MLMRKQEVLDVDGQVDFVRPALCIDVVHSRLYARREKYHTPHAFEVQNSEVGVIV